jgi:hypothetical protein
MGAERLGFNGYFTTFTKLRSNFFLVEQVVEGRKTGSAVFG